jgi:hypothetical protein
LPTEHLDAAVRVLFEETGMILTVDDCALLSGDVLRVPLLEGNNHLIYVYAAFAHVPKVNANLCTPAKVGQGVIT